MAWLMLWQAAASLQLISTMVPTPAQTWTRLVEILSRPAYADGVNSVGILWHLLASVRRVLIGFALAAAIAVPAGFLLATTPVLGAAADPFVQVLRPVSPLAWLPIGLAVLQDSELTAIFVIFMSSLWPVLLNTMSAVRAVDPAYLQLARTLEADRFTVVRRILLPASLPGIVTGLRVSLGVAWLVIIAAEMLVGGRGMGYFVWNEWNNLNVASILVAILLIGIVGLALDRGLSAVERLVRHD
jgi:nitrate/nitrite transport system permease protein